MHVLLHGLGQRGPSAMSDRNGGPALPWMQAPPAYFVRAQQNTRSYAQNAGIFEIALRPDASSFQAGYLGLEGMSAWIVGDVLIKLSTEPQQAALFTTCNISLRAIERVHGPDAQEMQLYAAKHTLWQASTLPAHVPGTLSFEFPLTSDLPQCIHGPSSELTYWLEAQLLGVHGQRLEARTTLHPTRYTHGALEALAPHASPGYGERSTSQWNTVTPNSRYSLSPLYWMTEAPVPVHYWLDRSVVRNTEPVEVQVHIPPPDQHLVVDLGLKLHSVEAELIRVTQSHPTGAMLSDSDTLQHTLDAQYARFHTGRAPEENTMRPTQPYPILRRAPVAYSGKSCRFHSQEPIHLCFALRSLAPLASHAPEFNPCTTQHRLGGDGGCETITQDTPLHSVRFILFIRVLLRDRHGEQRDICTGQLIKILPEPVHSDPDRESTHQGAASDPHGSSAKKLGKTAVHNKDDIATWFAQPAEYDGYDDASRPENSMLAMAVTPTSDVSGQGAAAIMHDPSQVEFSTTTTRDPPPSMPEHVNDARLPDDLRSNPSYANQLANIPTSEEPMAVYDSVLELSSDPAPNDELPDFEQVSQEPSPALLEFGMPMDATEPPAWQPSSTSNTIPVIDTRTDTLPPSYADSAPSAPNGAIAAEEMRPPAYFTTSSARTAASAAHPNTVVRTSTDRAAIFPPVYEA